MAKYVVLSDIKHGLEDGSISRYEADDELVNSEFTGEQLDALVESGAVREVKSSRAAKDDDKA